MVVHQTTVLFQLRAAAAGTPEWEGEVPTEPAAGWSELVVQCWQEAAAARPSFNEVVRRLEEMLRVVRMNKRRTASA